MKMPVILICLLICACKQNPITLNLKSIDFYSSPECEISYLSDIATDIEYIPLHVSGSGIMDVRITNDRYFVKNYFSEIECLDKKGRYLYKLSKNESAVDEYTSINDYDVTSNGKLLAVSTLQTIRIYEIDDTNFVFLKTIDVSKDILRPFTLRFIPGETKMLLSYNNLGTEPFIDILLNLEGHTLAVRSNYHMLKKRLEGEVFIRSIDYTYNNSLYCKESFNDTIYTIDKSDHIKPYLILDSQGQQFTQKIVARIQSGKIKNKLWDYFNIMNLSETSRYMIGLIIYKKTEFFRIYDKVLNKVYSFGSNSLYIKDNIAGGVDFTPQYCDGSKLYNCISISKLMDHVATEGFSNSEAIPEKKANLIKLVDSLKDSDSQILIVVTPKE